LILQVVARVGTKDRRNIDGTIENVKMIRRSRKT